jgi:hypothetical protein
MKGGKMEVRLMGSWKLTTDHAASSYGQPVLVDGTGEVYGPGDIVKIFEQTGFVPAAEAIKRLVKINGIKLDKMDEGGRDLVNKFCALYNKSRGK